VGVALRQLLDEHAVAQPLHGRSNVGIGTTHAPHRNVAR
jgi:hypothetical protein